MVRAVDALAYALLAGSARIGSTLVGLLLWSALPNQVALHFSTGGQPDDFVGKPLGVVLARPRRLNGPRTGATRGNP